MPKMEDVTEKDVQTVQQTSPTLTGGAEHQDIPPQIREAIEEATQDSLKRSGIVEQDNSNRWEIEGLPSKGRLYPEGTKIIGRPLKVIEVKKLASITDGTANSVINDIIRRAVRGIDVDDLLMADRLFIVMWLRANTYRDSAYVVQFDCPQCNKASQFHFQVDDLDVKYLSDSYDPSMEVPLPSGSRVTIRFLTVGDTEKNERFKVMNIDLLKEIDDELLNLASMLNTIDGERTSMLEKYNFVLGMDPDDFAFLATYIDENGMGLKPVMNVTCTDCRRITPVGITFRSEFFLPTYKSQ